jgi:hypothetical protein
MREDKNGIYERVSELLGADKAAMDAENRALLLRDFTYIAGEYFDLLTAPNVKIENTDGVYSVTIEFKANRVRSCKGIRC